MLVSMLRLPILTAEDRTPDLEPTARPVDEFWRPVVAVWELTLRCDLACNHCGSRAGHARSRELSTEECLNVADQLADFGVKEVSLIGGEAYLHPGWLEVVGRLARRGIEVAMVSGGRGIRQELVKAAKDAGLSSLSISVDGVGKTHDDLRNLDGLYAQTLGVFSTLREQQMPFSVNTQINRKNLHELHELVRLVVEVGAHSWQAGLTVPMGRAADASDLVLQPVDLLALFPRLAELKRVLDAGGVSFYPGNNLGYFGPFEEVLRGDMPRGHMYACGAGRTSLGIESDGTIKGCPSLPTSAFAGGNILEHGLLNIWERSSRLRFTRELTVADLWGYCRTCYYAEVCKGGCNWTSHVLLGKIGNNPLCHHRALEMARQGKKERLEKTHRAPGLPFDFGRFEIVEDAFTS